MARGVAALGIVIWLVAPFGLMAIVLQTAESESLVSTRITYSPVQPSSAVVMTTVELQLERRPGAQLVAPTFVGLVERVLVVPGNEIVTGTPVVAVGGITRIAVASEVPFARVLQSGDRGPDVERLRVALGALGFTAGSGATVDPPLLAAITALARNLGAATEPRVFDPAWFVFLPREGVVVAEASLTVAAPAPAAGEVIVTGVAEVAAAVVVAEQGTPGANGAEPDMDEGPEVAGETRESEPVSVPPGATLLVSDTPIELDRSRSAVAPEALATLASLIDADALVASAVISQPGMPGQWIVPPSAVFVVPSGETCVLRKREGEAVSVPVIIVGSTYSTAIVEGALREGDEVAIAPPTDLRNCQQ